MGDSLILLLSDPNDVPLETSINELIACFKKTCRELLIMKLLEYDSIHPLTHTFIYVLLSVISEIWC